jgi:hypothetical protein
MMARYLKALRWGFREQTLGYFRQLKAMKQPKICDESRAEVDHRGREGQRG